MKPVGAQQQITSAASVTQGISPTFNGYRQRRSIIQDFDVKRGSVEHENSIKQFLNRAREFLETGLGKGLMIGLPVATVFAVIIVFAILPLLNQLGNEITPPPPQIPVSTSAQTYTLTTSVSPPDAGQISRSPDMETYHDGDKVKLTAIPNNDCYTFGRWEIGDALDWGETITITMDSNRSVTHYFKLEDTIPPAILDVAVVHAKTTDISATITWETDDEVTSQVEYGETEAYGKTAQSKSEPDTSDGFKYSARLTGLEPNTTYYFKVKVKDKCGNPETSSAKELTTLSKIPDGYEVGKRALDFTLPYYHDDNPESPNKKGKTETLSKYIGKKKILLNFWNTFCGACIGEFPFIREIYDDEKLADRNSGHSDFAVITICIDSRIDEAADRIKILEDKYSGEVGPFTFPILLDSEGETKKSYHIWTIPYTIFIDSDGIIREIKMGRFKDEGEIIDILNRLD